MKFCPMCKLDLEEDNFTKNKARYDGYNSYCKSCRKHKYNKEKQNEYSINENKHNNLIWGISYCLSGKYKTSQGYKWMYL